MKAAKRHTIPRYLGIAWVAFALGTGSVKAQHINNLRADLDEENRQILIQQEFEYFNTSNDILHYLYFNDWANAYSDKNTGLAKRLGEEFNRSLHLAKDREKGYTQITSVVDDEYRGLFWKRTVERDILHIRLNTPLRPGESAKIFMTYTVKLPTKKFTSYGYDPKSGYYLKDWYLTPAVYDGTWHLYSNKDLEDLYTDVATTNLTITYPKGFYLNSNFRILNNAPFALGQQAQLEGRKQKSCEIILTPGNGFTTHVTNNMAVITDLKAGKYDEISQGVSIHKVTDFILENLGTYPHSSLLVSENDYQKYPLYGINQLPSFIRPYNDQFQFEMKFLKTALIKIINETIFLDPRKDQWILDALANYLMIAYIEENYPEQKLLGKLSKIWGIRSYQLAKMDFNEQYPFLHMLMARRNLDQPLTTPNDSLIKWNQKIGNKYKAGLGLSYLASYIGKEKVDESIKTFYEYYKLNKVKPLDFESILKRASDGNIDWFFEDYVSTDKRIDFKIKKVEKLDDSLRITLKNKKGTNVPISLFGLNKDSVVSKYWFSDITAEKIFTIPRNNEERLVLNYDQKIPEFNQRDNWKSLKGFLSGNKKMKFTFGLDAENPYYNQVFYTPVVNFNIYDGWTPGLRFHNKTFLERPFVYDFHPFYSFREQTLVGFGSIGYRKYLNKSGLYISDYRIGGSTSHFQVNSRFVSITPSVLFGWRPADLRSNKRKFLRFRHVNIFRDFDETLGVDLRNDPDTPDYSVFNARFTNVNNDIIDFSSWSADFQHSNQFTKLVFEMEYRKLYENNTQFNVRFFAGKFLRNSIESGNRFFDFALDRPTDYLFDYNYLGRSEDTGIYSQQVIIAEGGFKSFLDERYRFANEWLTTVNTSVNLWRWIEAYGDMGFVKNRDQSAKFVYDSGIRLNLVTDFFELYFPVYSNNGWEIAQPDYEERIRFVIVVNPRTLTGLFTRKWF